MKRLRDKLLSLLLGLVIIINMAPVNALATDGEEQGAAASEGQAGTGDDGSSMACPGCQGSGEHLETCSQYAAPPGVCTECGESEGHLQDCSINDQKAEDYGEYRQNEGESQSGSAVSSTSVQEPEEKTSAMDAAGIQSVTFDSKAVTDGDGNPTISWRDTITLQIHVNSSSSNSGTLTVDLPRGLRWVSYEQLNSSIITGIGEEDKVDGFYKSDKKPYSYGCNNGTVTYTLPTTETDLVIACTVKADPAFCHSGDKISTLTEKLRIAYTDAQPTESMKEYQVSLKGDSITTWYNATEWSCSPDDNTATVSFYANGRGGSDLSGGSAALLTGFSIDLFLPEGLTVDLDKTSTIASFPSTWSEGKAETVNGRAGTWYTLTMPSNSYVTARLMNIRACLKFEDGAKTGEYPLRWTNARWEFYSDYIRHDGKPCEGCTWSGVNDKQKVVLLDNNTLFINVNPYDRTTINWSSQGVNYMEHLSGVLINNLSLSSTANGSEPIVYTMDATGAAGIMEIYAVTVPCGYNESNSTKDSADNSFLPTSLAVDYADGSSEKISDLSRYDRDANSILFISTKPIQKVTAKIPKLPAGYSSEKYGSSNTERVTGIAHNKRMGSAVWGSVRPDAPQGAAGKVAYTIGTEDKPKEAAPTTTVSKSGSEVSAVNLYTKVDNAGSSKTVSAGGSVKVTITPTVRENNNNASSVIAQPEYYIFCPPDMSVSDIGITNNGANIPYISEETKVDSLEEGWKCLKISFAQDAVPLLGYSGKGGETYLPVLSFVMNVSVDASGASYHFNDLVQMKSGKLNISSGADMNYSGADKYKINGGKNVSTANASLSITVKPMSSVLLVPGDGNLSFKVGENGKADAAKQYELTDAASTEVKNLTVYIPVPKQGSDTYTFDMVINAIDVTADGKDDSAQWSTEYMKDDAESTKEACNLIRLKYTGGSYTKGKTTVFTVEYSVKVDMDAGSKQYAVDLQNEFTPWCEWGSNQKRNAERNVIADLIWPAHTYVVTIPSELSVGADGKGTGTIRSELEYFSSVENLTVKVTSANNFHLKTRESTSTSLSYTLQSDGKPLANLSEAAVFTNGTNQKTLTADVNDTVQYAGDYTDILTFTVEYNSGTGSGP